MKELIQNVINEYKGKMQTYSYANIIFGNYFNNELLKSYYIDRIYPFITLSDTLETAFDVYSLIDTNLFDKIKEITAEYIAGDAVASYCTKESGTVRIKKYKINDCIVILTSKKNSYWILDNDAKNILFIGNERSLEHFHREYYIFIEHILTKKCVENGALLIHAAAVEKNGKAVILVGNKRSGKTTTFFELCKSGQYFPVSVDKVLIVSADNKLKVFGVPTRLRVLAGTLSKYKELISYIPEKYRNTTQEILWKGESDSKVEIPIKEFEKFVSRKFQKEAVLSTLVFNHINSEINTARVNVCNTNINMEILLNNTFSPYNPEEDWWSEIGINNVENLVNNKNKKVSELKKLNFIDYETKQDFSLLFETIDNLQEGMEG